MDKGPILESWKEIAAHLNRDIRTCHRWERELGLPVHRLDGSPKARVFAYTDELDRWLEEKLRDQGVWVRLKKWQKAGLAAAVIFLLGAAVYRLVIWPSQPASRRIPLAVMYAVNNSGDKNLDARLRWQIPYYLSMDLAQSRYLSVLPQDRLMQILEDSKQMDEEYHLSKILDRIADAANVEYFVLPSFTQTGDGIWVSFTIRKAKTDEALGEPDIVKGKGSGDLFSVVAEMSLKVKSRLNLSSEEIAADKRPDLARIATPSPEAMRHYIDGEIAYVRGDYRASIRSLKEAVLADPNFALAYLQIAIDSEYVGDYGQVRTYLAKALSLAGRVSERDRYLIQGHASYTLEESPLKAIESYRKLIELYPEDEEGRIGLGAIRRNLEEWDLAEEQFDKILSLNPKNELALENNVFIYTAKGWYERAIGLCEGGLGIDPEGGFFARQLPLLYTIQGRYDRAAVELQKALEHMPDVIRLQELEGNLAHLKGDWPAAQRIYEQLQRRGEETPGALDLRGRYWLTHLRLERGEYRRARQTILEGMELAGTDDRVSDEIDCRLLLAYIEIQNGRFSRAVDALKPALETEQKTVARGLRENVFHLLGLASLGMGQTEEARRISEQLRLSIERASFLKEMRRYDHLMGQIALAEGRPAEAVRRFEHAISLLPCQRENVDMHAFYENSLAEAYDRGGDWSRALETYQRIVSLTTGRLQWGDIYARSFYRMGKICQRNGREVEAAGHYRNFLKFWKNADAGLPEVDDAKRQLEALGVVGSASGDRDAIERPAKDAGPVERTVAAPAGK